MDYDTRYDEELTQPFPNRHESKLKVCARRNRYLQSFFDKVKLNIKLFGDPQRPAIIVNNTYVLSAYVQNFNLHFADKPSNGKVLKTFKLTANENITHQEFMQLFKQADHRQVYRIKYINTSLYLAGYNFEDRDNQAGKFPVFAESKFKIYFNKNRAEQIVQEFDSLPLEVV